MAHGFKMQQQPDGSTDLDPACYSVAQALAERFSDIYGQPAGIVFKNCLLTVISFGSLTGEGPPTISASSGTSFSSTNTPCLLM